MVNESPKFKNFLEKYQMKIVDANRRVRYFKPLSYRDYDSSLTSTPWEITYETEALFTIQVPESKLESLIELYDRVEESIRYRGNIDVFDHLMEKDRKEREFREKHPAVKNAYEQYQTMCILAREEYKDDRYD